MVIPLYMLAHHWNFSLKLIMYINLQGENSSWVQWFTQSKKVDIYIYIHIDVYSFMIGMFYFTS